MILVGTVGNFQALRLIEVTLPTTRFLAGSAIGAGVTVLALMLPKNGSGCEEREGQGRPSRCFGQSMKRMVWTNSENLSFIDSLLPSGAERRFSGLSGDVGAHLHPWPAD